MKMRLGGLLVAAAVAVTAPAYAATTITFENGATKNGSGFGDSYTWNVNVGGQAVSLTATGWTDNTAYNPDRLQKSDLELYTGSGYGLGVVAPGDSPYDVTHTVDNSGSTKDFIVLKFSKAVDLASANFNVFDINWNGPADGDATVYYKNGAAAPTDGGNANSYFSQFTAIDVPGSTSGSRNVAGPGIYSDTWVVAANLGQNNDAFKLYSVTVNGAVPEPATWGLMIVGIGLMGSQLRARRRAASSVA